MRSDPLPAPPAALDHVTVCASDVGLSLRFYDATLAALGWARVIELGDEEEDDPPTEAVSFGPTDAAASLWLVGGTPATTAAHICFRAGSRAEVEAFHDAALGSGGAGHTGPRRWTIYRRGEFHAIVRDPDGNLLEAVAEE